MKQIQQLVRAELKPNTHPKLQPLGSCLPPKACHLDFCSTKMHDFQGLGEPCSINLLLSVKTLQFSQLLQTCITLRRLPLSKRDSNLNGLGESSPDKLSKELPTLLHVKKETTFQFMLNGNYV